ncbi:MAG TPA: START domain-containing protein [Labilithrix sp.]|jgi:hypothetical protein
MLRRSFLIAVALVFVAADAAADPPWTKIDESDGITVYKREIPGSDVIAFRGEATVNAPLVRVASVVFDTSRATEWIDDLKEARVVRRTSDFEYVEYDHFGTPFVMKDRDFVTANKLEWDAATKTMTIRMHSVTDPNARETSYVRGELVSSTFTLTPTPDGKATRIAGDVHCDPKGSVPKWIVNYFQKDWPHATFVKLRTQVAKANIVENPAIKKLVEP